MTTLTGPTWRDQLILNRDVELDSARAELSRRAARGDLVRVASGSYVSADLWNTFGDREQFLTRVRVVAAKSSESTVFCHASAAAIWGLPWYGPWPDYVDVLRDDGLRGQYGNLVRRHRSRDEPGWSVVDGLRVTSLARTVADVAGQPDFVRAVVVGDAALNDEKRAKLAGPAPELDREILRAEADRTGRAPVRTRKVIDFMDARSGSPGESISRVTMWRAGAPEPVLQQQFGSWSVDFWWPEFGVIGEFDGAVKYLDPAYRGGKTADEIVYAEKRREDQLRAQARGFARWGYVEAIRPALLAERLRAAGVPVPRRSSFASISGFL